MTTVLLTDFYDEVFVQTIKKHHNASGKKIDVWLMVDNAPTHLLVAFFKKTMAHLKFGSDPFF